MNLKGRIRALQVLWEIKAHHRTQPERLENLLSQIESNIDDAVQQMLDAKWAIEQIRHLAGKKEEAHHQLDLLETGP